MKKSILSGLLGLVGLFGFAAQPASAADPVTVKLAGATSEKRTIEPKAPEIETKCGVKLDLVANSSGRGLQALLGGNADIAMVAGTLDLNAANLNKAKPGTVDTSKLKEFNVFEDTLHPVCNPKNAVDTLTMEQVKGILTGKIKNWKEVGGADEAIVVVVPQPTDGGYMTVKAKILGDDAYVADARAVQSAPDQNKVVNQLPGGFSMLSTANKKDDQVKAIKLDKYVGVVNSLVTVGEPNAKLAEVIKAVQEACKK